MPDNLQQPQNLSTNLRSRFLKLNQLTVRALNNGIDRLWRPEKLIRSNRTPFEVIHDFAPMQLRYYPPLTTSHIQHNGDNLTVNNSQHAVPILIVPPLASSALIFDLLPERSLVRYLLARGHQVYLADWGEPENDKFSHLGMQDYAQARLGSAVEHVRQNSQSEDITLLGWCMGGLFSVVYAGLADNAHVRNIITIASPLDSRQGGVAGQLTRTLMPLALAVRKYTGFRLHNVDPKYLQVPGWLNSLAFKLTNPTGTIMSYWDLIIGLPDRDFIKAHTTTSDFLDNMHDYPGGIVQDFVVKLGIDNDFSNGLIKIGDDTSEFSRINASVLVFAGLADKIVTPKATQKLLELVTSDDKTFVVAPGGHAGVVMGKQAATAVWEVLGDWLATRSD